MSKDVPARVDALFICPFCSKPVWKVEVSAPPWVKEIGSTRTSWITFKVICSSKAPSASDDACPTVSGTGCYYLFLRPDGSGHASYF